MIHAIFFMFSCRSIGLSGHSLLWNLALFFYATIWINLLIYCWTLIFSLLITCWCSSVLFRYFFLFSPFSHLSSLLQNSKVCVRCVWKKRHRFKIKENVAHTGLPSVGFRSWSRYLAISLQMTWVINPAVGSHYCPPGLQLPFQPLRGLLPVSLLGEQRHDGCEQFA